MPMLPLPFLFAALALWGLAQAARSERDGRVRAMVAFAIVAAQMIVVGIRFGYGVGALVPVQQVIGALLPPAVVLAFLPLADVRAWLWVLMPVAVVLLAMAVAPGLADGLIAATALAAAGTLAWAGSRGMVLVWFPIGQDRADRFWLWVAVVTLTLMAAADMSALALALLGQGGWSGPLIGAIMLMGAAGLVWAFRSKADRPADPGPSLLPLFQRLDQLLADGLAQDPDLTLARIARRLSVPARDISQAVNRHAGQNLSQFVNNHRIRMACELLRQTDQPVTQVMLAAGFNTKSNFHREFLRVTGTTPGDWRKGA